MKSEIQKKLEARVEKHFEDSVATKQKALTALSEEIVRGIQSMHACLAQGKKILACGNGGSAADAHGHGQCPGRARSNGDDTRSGLTATAKPRVDRVGRHSLTECMSRSMRPNAAVSAWRSSCSSSTRRPGN